jgi:NADPH-dependent 2,4-dienoyl-CoA reductase/sulfur reductase-like enzyme
MRQRILVVGGLAAGPSAASKAKRINPDAEVILFEEGEHVSYGICEIPYYLSGSISDIQDINPMDPATLERTRGVNVKTLHSVEEILPVRKKIIARELEHNRVIEYSYDKLILTTGSTVRKLGVKGVDARNVFRVKSLADGIAIKRYVTEMKPRACVIIGGGYVGMELCETLRSLGINVTLLHLDDYPMTGLEQETREAVLAELTRHKVEFRPRQKVTGFNVGLDGCVKTVVTESGSFNADIVILSIGVEPNTSLASQIGIRLGRYNGIVTDERQVTNIDSIFAAGDCCEVKNVINNKFMYIPLATYASRQGRVAGENAAGGATVFKGVIRSIGVKVFDLEVAQVGLSLDESRDSGIDAEKMQVIADSNVKSYPGNRSVNIVAILDRRRRRIVGANVFGGPGTVLRANLLGLAIQQKISVEDISHLDLVYSPPFSPLWDPVLVLANQLRKE